MENEKTVYQLGWLPDVPDRRDVPFRAVFRVPAKLPAKVDLRGGCSPVEQQGNLGSCTAQALIGALEFLQLKAKSKVASHPSLPNWFQDLSRLFVYYNTRVEMGTVHEDSGAMLRTGIKVLKTLGVCKEQKWPYKISRFKEKPPADCYQEAEKHQVTAYQRLHKLDEMRACLSMGLPFVFGFAVYEHVMGKDVRRTGNIRLPRQGERMLGGHAVMAVGYDDGRKNLIFRNSWGAEWGRGGYGALPYGYAESRELSDDFWCIQATESDLYAMWKKRDAAVS
ncbi:MAG: C1 family peptidase [Kiritimatiellae bacterium]|nr:C1 family peptidase [Kiritimatiellia bacterium]